LRRILTVAEEIQAELEMIQTCPAPCEDGTVWVSPPSGTPQKRRCPLLSFNCLYGGELQERLDEYLNRLLIDAGVPLRHVGQFDTHFETPALLWANKWSFAGFLLFFGKSGVGKSFGAAWAVKRYLRSRILDLLDARTWICAANASAGVMWRTANKIIHDKSMIAETWTKRLLVLDDLGREGNFPTRRADVSDIVSARYDAKLPTIITTELTFADIVSVYGKYTAHKLAEDVQDKGAGGMIIDCGDVSLRQELEDGFNYEEKSVQWGPKK
jgi:hypothetical protein